MTKQAKKPEVSYITIEKGGQRIDNFLLTRLKGVPKSYVYRILRKGEVRANKKRVKPEYRLQDGDVIRIPPVRQESKIVKRAPDRLIRAISKQIIYEDKYFLVVNKPAGVAVHGGSGVSFGVIEALRQSRPQDKQLELAHRLDRETSGCLLLVKKPSILKEVHQLLREGEVEKRYTALLQGKLENKRAKKVEAPLKKFEPLGGERVVRVHRDGKPATTYFSVVESFADSTLVQVRLVTGRTHQIRVHAQFIGHPIAGDEKYGDKEFNKKMRRCGLKRLFLHSSYLQFTLPSNDKKYTFDAPLAPELEKII